MSKKTKFLIGVLIATGLIFIYTLYSPSEKTQGNLSVAPGGIVGGSAQKTSSSSDESSQTLVNLKSIKIDTSFFKGKTFQDLIDFSVQLKPQEVGRSNPFAPLETEALPKALPKI